MRLDPVRSHLPDLHSFRLRAAWACELPSALVHHRTISPQFFTWENGGPERGMTCPRMQYKSVVELGIGPGSDILP